ncbi:hypothetical protein [Ralstonia solanacearum]|nr:hypothetical protein [Ralstonia solanacearum]
MPTDDVHAAMLIALGWPTPYWPELAVGWLEQGAPIDAGILAALASVAGNGQFPQRLRHRASALTRKLSKTSNEVGGIATCQLPADGSSRWAGMADVELVMPNGHRPIRLRYAGEPPHGDSYHSIWIDGVRAPGYACGCQFACTMDSRFLAMSWMEKLLDRRTTVFDLADRRYFVLPFYMYDFRFRWPRLESVEASSEGRSYQFDGAEVWREC